MSTLIEYRKKVRDMFLISVKNDLDLWKDSDDGSYRSQNYKNKINNKSVSYFNIDTKNSVVKVHITEDDRFYDRGVDQFIKYKFWIFPIDFEVNSSVNNIKKHFKKIKEDNLNMSKIVILKDSLNNIEDNFQREIRKNKLDQISKK